MQNEYKIKSYVFEVTQKVERFGISLEYFRVLLAIKFLFPLLPEKIKSKER